MSKALFRFLRGELNGFYITNLHNLLNVVSEDIKSFLIDFYNMQLDVLSMPIQTIYNIGTFAGVYLLRLSTGEAYGAMRMSESHVVNSQERSERGLLERDSESFVFEHTAQDEYEDDINTLATSDKRSSLVGDEQVQGYISSDASDVIDEEGNVNPAVILSEPPSDVAYSEFYGNKFLFLAENTSILKEISPELLIELIKVMQYIRYNGVNLTSFLRMVSVLCPDGLVRIKSISKVESAPAFEVDYTLDMEAETDRPQQRVSMLEYLTLIKFPQFILMEA
jgi:hypothetical protein